MKKLLLILSSLALSINLAHAQDSDYGVDVNTNGLKIGESTIEVSIRSKNIPVSNAHLKLTVIHPDNNFKVYKINKPINIDQYVFRVNTVQQGKYKYVLKFNRMGGVNHFRKGNWQI